MKLHNKYYILRHGEALSNVRQVISSWPETFKNPLTKHGKETIKESVEILKDKGINVIFASDLLRTKQTAQIVGKALKLEPKFDKRLRELGFGTLNGRQIASLDTTFKNEQERIKTSMPKGESYQDVQKRVFDFLKDTDKKYKNSHILIVSHEGPLWMLEAKVQGISLQKHLQTIPRDHRIHKGQIKELN
ncbi:MAG: hypothetical protein A2908_02740 [Candidatus Staskawiczbacteria bacterium RIFCSPLOWO2_01_FULL_38_12b]|uniref:Phosphoglycerate mutase n=1 Tax=Candidatus Staskawiczbacteria bacterium RIFCSPLOWO2_01_FULL_38_12b TaxID=1802214 RepID=A0A1G2ID98_9BACT|nr:MAG: hypothetical protein A2908_02740 [Candidatus Staskawiczbacteria bacterium RIFCSPLOWO2_01_FULL_38_12b]